MSKNKKTEHKADKHEMPLIYKAAALLIIAAAALYFIFVNTGNKGTNPDEEYMFRKNGELVISSDSVQVKIDIQIANTEFDRQLGLMFRKSMDENQGMLFIFPDVQVRSFWMRNTEIPLDMIFIDASKTILNIAKNTTPYSDISYGSSGPAKYVLEVKGGFADMHNISIGDKIAWTETQ
ncbi:MAG TPA: DUF192 domain-containing protein [Ignavibacteriaceae bacterium]|nr:DUF192 domain-containing protein [Ignavibacteriaceae bacterium]